jgi:DNA polymerase III alpha subunit
MLYEDDALGVVQVLTGFSAPEADRFRKQVTKCTDPNEAAELSKAFLIACERNGVSREVAERVWVQLAKFNSYSFCKSHSVSYGLIAWEAAFYKANYPLGFWVAALNNNQGMYPRRVYIEALKRAGISVLLPCVNRSEREFALEENRQGDRQTRRQGDSDIKLEIDNNRLPSVSLSPCPLVPLSPCHPVPLSSAGIRTGLAVIHSLDEAAREAILEDRTRRGPFGSLTDFRRRVSIGPEALALLIQVGAFDFTGQARPAMLLEAELDDYCKARKAKGKEPSPGEALFADSSIPDDSWLPADYSQTRRWKQEWDRLGFLVGPPVMQLYRPLLPKGLVDSRSLHEFIGRRIRAAGLVATARFAPTKTGQHVQFVTLEDEWGFIDVVLFAGTFSQVTYLGMGPYIVHGIVEEQHDVITVTATRWEKPLRDGEEW